MQNFELNTSMLTLGGVFYPTGYLFAMFPSTEHAQQVVQKLSAESHDKPTLLVSAEAVLGQIVSTVGSADMPLPSVGTEAATIRKYAELASLGHCALMVYADSAEETEAVMALVRTTPFSCARKYRMLAIEDMV
nr:RNA-binding protein [uncultured Albidiferax sp.]